MSAPASARRPSRAAGPLLAVAATLGTLLVLEVGLRLVSRWNGGGMARLWTAPAPLPRGTPARLGQILQRSSERRIVYELQPHLDVLFENARVTTDGQGFRRTGAAPPRGPALRIVGLGDSLMFGWGVADDQAYLSRLEARLRERDPAWQVVNTAVPGYNTVMEVEALKRKALALGPRVVVLEIVGNDLDLPNFLAAPAPRATLRRSLLLDFVTRRVRRLARGTPPPADEADLVAAPEAGDDANRHFEDDPSRVPPEYADLVGRAAFEGALRDLARLRDQHGFTVFMVSQAPGFDRVQHLSRRRARELGFVYVDVAPAIRRRLAEGGFSDYVESPLTLRRHDAHPSPLGHEIASEELHRAFVERGLVAR